MSVHVDQAAPREIEACAALLATAFHDDAVLRALVPGDANRHARLTAVLLSELHTGPRHGGVLDVARTDAGDIVGVAAWHGPDRHVPWRVRLAQTPRHVHGIGLRHLRAARRAQRAFDTVRPTAPHWYLADLAVSPTAQGLGVGSALLRHRLGAIDAGPRLPAFLEATTPGSQRLYGRWGFEPTGTVTVEGAVATAMTRPAACAN